MEVNKKYSAAMDITVVKALVTMSHASHLNACSMFDTVVLHIK